jgi:outer membrane protein TolC
VDSQRDVINYELQFEQEQAEVVSDMKDLLALTLISPPGDSQTLALDSLDQSLQAVSTWTFQPPDSEQPMIKSQALQAEGSERQAASTMAALYPTVQASANASIIYPDAVLPQRAEQNTFAISMTLPLFEADHSRHLAAMKRKEAEAARFSEQQIEINLERDYEKALDLLKSLKGQQRLSALDVKQSEESAQLYYQSYRAGKINLIDVQAANNRALLAKVNSARISAQILTQYYTLQSISGDKTSHGSQP